MRMTGASISDIAMKQGCSWHQVKRVLHVLGKIVPSQRKCVKDLMRYLLLVLEKRS